MAYILHRLIAVGEFHKEGTKGAVPAPTISYEYTLNKTEFWWTLIWFMYNLVQDMNFWVTEIIFLWNSPYKGKQDIEVNKVKLKLQR